MEYTIKKIANLSGVSARTLRFYDEIDLLKPARVNSSGYRIYGQNEVNRLQQILFYREMDLKLEEIKEILDNPDFDVEQALMEHQEKLVAKRQEIDRLLASVQQTMKYYKGEIEMSDQEKFTAFKEQKVAENEAKYGKEIREKYGEETVERSNKKYLNLTEEQMQEMAETEVQLFETIGVYLEQPEIESDVAKEIFRLHKKWLSYTWPTYSAEAHKGLGMMYIADERFMAYYDEKHAGAAQALNDAIKYYA
ncbi:MerR family transcriptional regulator [Enterococcus saccharolyticus]|uniref:MerR family transcriptional regulator n=1 Tax=Enterococcus saccharolyticus subsp. saccharolyticus ATCC 43076 TaxID=1139996 RepID=S0JSS9_9ENTE|nr:MerR family transcriptional regulator [Enterococcus saccharolyticus]EOT29986.1 MerR family transcriptional regulator [Enterococcus saccharolyticus subsp. saccharolyticus ATCC 43076]EOT80532.1 MerR family transcriptional regulator [Enterococcus saccharolyticus subsp. saccharolyticus ATCC 43076]OJG90071.1 MerR family transcriptional regulator [Enterococcus saccharolyticus]